MTPSPAKKGDGADTIPPPPAPADEIPVPSAISTAAEKTASLHFGELYDAVASLTFSADHPDLPEVEVRHLCRLRDKGILSEDEFASAVDKMKSSGQWRTPPGGTGPGTPTRTEPRSAALVAQ